MRISPAGATTQRASPDYGTQCHARWVATVETLAEVVCVDPADLQVVVASMEADEITPDVITAVHAYLNPNRERTVPELYVEGVSPDWREED